MAALIDGLRRHHRPDASLAGGRVGCSAGGGLVRGGGVHSLPHLRSALPRLRERALRPAGAQLPGAGIRHRAGEANEAAEMSPPGARRRCWRRCSRWAGSSWCGGKVWPTIRRWPGWRWRWCSPRRSRSRASAQALIGGRWRAPPATHRRRPAPVRRERARRHPALPPPGPGRGGCARAPRRRRPAPESRSTPALRAKIAPVRSGHHHGGVAL